MYWVIIPVMASGRVKFLMQTAGNCESILNFSGNCSLFKKEMENKCGVFLKLMNKCRNIIRNKDTGLDFTEVALRNCVQQGTQPEWVTQTSPCTWPFTPSSLFSFAQSSLLDPSPEIPTRLFSWAQSLFLFLVSIFPWKPTKHWQ